MEINKVYVGKCEIILQQFLDNTFDSCVTDPPYGYKFMGKKWDYQVPTVDQWKEILRVLKPGAHILVACGTRTQHRMAVNIEDAGFEIRDVITWHYGSGFPKSKNLGDGIGTQLKPATEFWTMARKPLAYKSIQENFKQFGTGGINIHACRIQKQEGDRTEYGRDVPLDYPKESVAHGKYRENSSYTPDPDGRFPSNVIIDEYISKQFEESRYFYCPKPDSFERNKGVDPLLFRKVAEHHMGVTCGICGGRIFQSDRPSACKCDVPDRQSKIFEGNHHPTVKPIDLMRYLVRLVTPKGGIVVDPFVGSGPTIIGAKLELINYVAIDMDPEYCAISEARVAAWNPERYLPQELF